MINQGEIIIDSVHHVTLLIVSANNGKTYSMGFSSGKNNKLCIFSPDPVFITMMRNKPHDINDDLIYQQDEISDRSIDKLKQYLGNTKGSFPARRKIPKVCYDKLEYKAIFSRQRSGFNCWTAIEDIFPSFTRSIRQTIPSVSAFLARGSKTLKKTSNTKRKKSKGTKSKGTKSKGTKSKGTKSKGTKSKGKR
jgi:hypothetical protein